MALDPPPDRPLPTAELSEEEFRRWYWRRDELVALARSLGVGTSGAKEVVADRIAAQLGGRPVLERTRPRPAATEQLTEPLSASSVVPRGQRCSQLLRHWFVQEVGPGFRFDEPMRRFFADSDGIRTLAAAVEHWHRTRDGAAAAIDAQFEYNRFTRAWWARHPDGSRDELRAAWVTYRSTPVDVRGRA